jgi:hypothetical protein
MSPHELLFQSASTIQIQLSECIGLVQIGHLIEYNLYNIAEKLLMLRLTIVTLSFTSDVGRDY